MTAQKLFNRLAIDFIDADGFKLDTLPRHILSRLDDSKDYRFGFRDFLVDPENDLLVGRLMACVNVDSEDVRLFQSLIVMDKSTIRKVMDDHSQFQPILLDAFDQLRTVVIDGCKDLESNAVEA